MAGGMASQSVLTSSEIYDPATGKWNLTNPMTMLRSEHAAVRLVNGTILAIGGRPAP